MADIKKVLLDEIRRISRKEIKVSLMPLMSKMCDMKKTILAQSKLIKELRQSSDGNSPKNLSEAQVGDDISSKEKSVRLNGKGIRKIREGLGLSQKDFATLVDASHLSVCHWEIEKTEPRAASKKKIAALRRIGKHDFEKLCSEKGVSLEPKKRGRKTAV